MLVVECIVCWDPRGLCERSRETDRKAADREEEGERFEFLLLLPPSLFAFLLRKAVVIWRCGGVAVWRCGGVAETVALLVSF